MTLSDLADHQNKIRRDHMELKGLQVNLRVNVDKAFITDALDKARQLTEAAEFITAAEQLMDQSPILEKQ